MGYNSACTSQYCSANCCNYYGSCPDYYSSSSYSNQCWYYYSSSSSTCYSTSSTCCYSSSSGYYSCGDAATAAALGSIIGGAVGGFVGLVLLIVGIVILCKRYRQQPIPIPQASNDKTVIISGGAPNMYPQYPPGYGQQIQGQAYGQPVQGQPIYVQPSGQPYGPPQGNPQLPPAYSSIALDASPQK